MRLPLSNGKTIEGLSISRSSVVTLDDHKSETPVSRNLVGYVSVGFILMALYLGQELLDVRWDYLVEKQQDDYYKKLSGFVLGGFMILQWSLTWVKVVKRWNSASDLFTTIHKWMGALSPILFYAHAIKFGYAYLFFLSCLFFTNMAVGFLNPEKISIKANWYIQGWMIFHVTASVLLTLLMFYHSFIAFYYK